VLVILVAPVLGTEKLDFTGETMTPRKFRRLSVSGRVIIGSSARKGKPKKAE